jgi:hypothetical protein
MPGWQSSAKPARRPLVSSQGYAVVVARCIDLLIAGWIWRDYGITISSMTGLATASSPPLWARALNAFLNSLETGHCELAIACDIERAYAALGILGPYDEALKRLKTVYHVT